MAREAHPGRAFTLNFPLSRTQWVMLVSNRPMTSEAFARLDRMLALQKEVAAEDAIAMETRQGGNEVPSRSDESAAIAQNPDDGLDMS